MSGSMVEVLKTTPRMGRRSMALADIDPKYVSQVRALNNFILINYFKWRGFLQKNIKRFFSNYLSKLIEINEVGVV